MGKGKVDIWETYTRDIKKITAIVSPLIREFVKRIYAAISCVLEVRLGTQLGEASLGAAWSVTHKAPEFADLRIHIQPITGHCIVFAGI